MENEEEQLLSQAVIEPGQGPLDFYDRRSNEENIDQTGTVKP